VIDELYALLKAMEGTESKPRTGNDSVNEAMIRHWCEAMQDSNPLYSNKDFAESHGYRGIVAPPTMVQAYCTPPLWPKAETPPDPIFEAVRKCTENGYSASLGISITYEFLYPLHPGDQVVCTIRLVSVSPRKTTRVGTGYFLTSQYAYRNQTGLAICNQSLTVFQYEPGSRTRQ
jgi:acyl dehydratase